MSIETRIARIFGVDQQKVDSYYSQSDSIEEYISRKLGKKELWALTPDKRKAMYAIVRLLRPKLAVETGVGPGSSTTVILSAMRNGHLHSIDLGVKYGSEDETYPVGFIIPERLKKKWTLHTGNSARLLLPLLEKLGTIQMFYHDSTHEEKHVTFELSNAWEHIESGAILVDNYQWTKAPEKLCRKTGAKLTMLSQKSGGFCIIPKNME